MLASTISASSNASCNGLSDGSATVSPTGGTTPYTYLWNDANNTTTASVSGLAAGSYTVTVTDNNGCTTTNSVTITQPTVLVASVASSTNVSCNGLSDGSASTSGSGGTTPYTYLWNDANNTTTATVGGLPAGSYTVTITDNNGCSSTASVSITEPAALTSTISASSNASCNGLSDGAATVSPAGGTTPYTYLWNDANNTSAASVSGLSAGSYTVTITDNNGCTTSNSISITQPAVLVASVASSTNVSCNGLSDGAATTSASGGTTPYTYLWNDANNTTTATVSGLPAGSYAVTITDNNGCSSTALVSITEPTALTSTITASSNATCNGLSNGSATVSPAGGTTPYTYLWNDINTTTTAAVNGLAAGNYTVTVTDNNGCTTTNSVTITQPAVLVASVATSTNVSCHGLSDGSATTSASGGTVPYTYLWNNASNTTTASVSGLPVGTYTVTITDQNGCSSTTSVNITQPNVLTLSLQKTNISCFGRTDGQISSSSNGGTTPYTYNWSNNRNTGNISGLSAGSYTVTLTDSKGCSNTATSSIVEPPKLEATITADDTICINASKTLVANGLGGTGNYTYTWSNNLGNNQTVTVLPASNTVYKVSVTDQNNCPEVVKSTSVKVRDISKDSIRLTNNGPICDGEAATLTPYFKGAIGPFTYSWSDASLSGYQNQVINPANSTTYIFSVADACNNSISASSRVEVDTRPTLNYGDTTVRGCDPLTVRLSNNTPSNYTYNWQFGDGSTSKQANPIYTYKTPGTYLIKYNVISNKGCESVYGGTFRVKVDPTPVSEINASARVVNIETPVISFSSSYDDAIQWYWNYGFGPLDSLNTEATITYPDTGRYNVSLRKINQFGCESTDYETIYIEPNYEIKIPNVFTPIIGGSGGSDYDPNNPDNTVFFPFVEYATNYRLRVFNRWGELLFETMEQSKGWDGYYLGQLCQSDVYVYRLDVTFVNGQTATKVGDVTLLR